MADRYPKLVAAATRAAAWTLRPGQRPGYAGVLYRIPYAKAPAKEWPEVWRCDHSHRYARTARDCATRNGRVAGRPVRKRSDRQASILARQDSRATFG